jgi:hypothetical protein
MNIKIRVVARAFKGKMGSMNVVSFQVFLATVMLTPFVVNGPLRKRNSGLRRADPRDSMLRPSNTTTSWLHPPRTYLFLPTPTRSARNQHSGTGQGESNPRSREEALRMGPRRYCILGRSSTRSTTESRGARKARQVSGTSAAACGFEAAPAKGA